MEDAEQSEILQYGTMQTLYGCDCCQDGYFKETLKSHIAIQFLSMCAKSLHIYNPFYSKAILSTESTFTDSFWGFQ